MKIGIIIPCYNEEKGVKIKAFKKCLKKYSDVHLCFVNDGSKDNTLDVLYKLKDEFEKKVTIINMKKNQGKSRAIKVGARFFYSLSSVAHVGCLDANFTIGYENFGSLLKNLKKI
ncbi:MULTISPECIES: glycosyltransferase [Tenacibaculum]|uniref:glycosyltransferase n=1 Tax=Tenacibaculum TaxID=104267 RepID=UPI000896A261|nr:MULTISPECIES: glycosyltransferase [unclassified Tenacibaculum]RBW56325.1 glycosyltransferase [Tenacibaculum sp. E3R01]SEE45899.1 Glycosyl transferase family 2 [Tenacibaculum sp. MAR_2010_89]